MSNASDAGYEAVAKICRVLSRSARIHVIEAIADGASSRIEIADAVAKETGRPRHDVRTTLVHVHLPVLEEASVVEHDSETGAVTAGACFTDVYEFVLESLHKVRAVNEENTR
ncbi:hypothetical protein ACFQE1_04375 [Halobium palmae]|uniref:DUF7344 domain-containing protein n=1 Tax=Halobium palmae TaxID=1776492 RepID=A0ABD5RWI7_9EURY